MVSPTPDRPRIVLHRACASVRWLVAALAATLAAGCVIATDYGAEIDVDSEFGGLGDVAGRFALPRAMEHDGESLWIIDRSARVQRIDPATGDCLALWKMPDWQAGKPVGFGIGPPIPAYFEATGGAGAPSDADDLLYIADTHYNRVMVYARPPLSPVPAPTGAGRPEGWGGEPRLVAKFGEYGKGPGQFIYPTDVAVLTTPGAGSRTVERLYVGEYGGNDRISVFDNRCNFLFSFGKFGNAPVSGPGAPGDEVVFDRPQSILITEVNGVRELLIADSRNHRLGRFDLDGRLIRWIGSRDAATADPGHFRYPYGLADLGDGTVLVSEYGNNRVQRIDLKTGEGLGSWGHAGRERGGLATPWAVTVMGKQTFVLDSGNHRVVAFSTPRRRG